MAHHPARIPLAIVAAGALPLAAPLAAVEINQTLFGEVLIEGINQNNYTDANGSDYIYVDPNVYANFGTLSTVGGNEFYGNLLVDPDTFNLIVPDTFQNTYYSDRSSQMWIRAKLGAKIELADKVEANVSVVYDGEGGDQSQLGNIGATNGGVFVNDANILLKRIILPEIHMRIGRQPVSWNLRKGYGAWLYDSRANNPRVTSWDGIRGFYQWDNFTFSPYMYLLDENREERGLGVPGNGTSSGVGNSKDNWLAGLHVDWQPELLGDNRLFITAAITGEWNVPVKGANPATFTPTLIGDKLLNYYAGVEADVGWGVTAWAEGSFQEGDLDRNTGFDGMGFSAGAEWEIGGFNNAIIGLQYDYQSGDRGATSSLYNQLLDGSSVLGQLANLSTLDKIFMRSLFPNDDANKNYGNFVAPHEGVSDALILEHERYGELSELLVGNFIAIKAKAEYRFDQLDANRPITMKFLYTYAMLDTPAADAATQQSESNYFGSEFDLSVSWQFSKYTTVSAFGGIFMPGLGYQQAIVREYPTSRYLPEEVRGYQTFEQLITGGPGFLTNYYDTLYPNISKDDPITMAAINVQVVF